MGRAARQRTDGPDTDLGVVHQRGKRPVPAAPPELVNNSAAGHGARSARKTRPATLRALCRDEITLIEQRTALVNQLLAALSEYYPAALEIFEDWTRPFAWALIQQLPTPLALQNAGKRQWEKFRHPQRLWRTDTAPARLERFARANDLSASAAVTHAQSLLATSLVKVLQTLEAPLQEYRRRSTEAFTVHPDHDIFGSLPGAGQKLAPRRLSETGPGARRLSRRRRPLLPGRGQPGELPERQARQSPDPPGRRRRAAAHGPSVGRLQPSEEPPGRRRTIKANASKATATPVPCAVWANAASRGSGACGRTAKPMIPPATNRASRTTAHG